MKRKVLSLVRVSTEGQADDERDGLPSQRRDIEAICKQFELEVVEEFPLTGISGTYVEKSPKFQRMLKRLSESDISGLVFARMNRFFRPGLLSQYTIFEAFEKTKKLMYCDLGALDQHKAQDRMTIQIWGMVAGIEKDNIKSQMSKGKDASRRNPSRKSDPLPFFVRFVPTDKNGNGQFEYITDEEKKVVDAVQMFLNGQSLKTIAEDLGYDTPTALRLILKNPWMYGYKSALNTRDHSEGRRFHEDGRLMDAKRRVRRDDPILTRTNLADTPLVPKSQFDAVQHLLVSNHRQWTQRKSNSNNFLATGLLFCECGEKMYHKLDRRPGKPSYYLCATRCNGRTSCGFSALESTEVDHQVIFSVMTYFYDKNFIAAKLREQSNDTDVVDKIKLRFEQTEKDINKLTKQLQVAALEVLDDPGLYKPVVAKKKVELAAAQAKLDALKAELEANMTAADVEEASERMYRAFDKFPSLSIEKKKAVLKEHIRRITMENGRAELVVRTGLPVPQFASKRSKYLNAREQILEVIGRTIEGNETN
ncbi:MAG: recombinase family protein [Bryobacteraceae bacterium]